MSKLPSFDDSDNNESQDNLSYIDKLLEEFEDDKELNESNLNDDLSEPDFNSDFESFVKVEDIPINDEWNDKDYQETKVDYEDELDNESLNEDELNESSHDNYDESQENENLENDYELEDNGNIYEVKDNEPEDNYEPEDNFMGTLLPGMETEHETSITDKTEEYEPEDIDEPKDLINDEKDADEKAKEIFDNLKNKIIGLFKPKGKGAPRKDKKLNEDNRESKVREIKPSIKIDKNQKIILLSSILSIVVTAIIIFLLMKSHSPLEDINVSAKFNDKDFDEKIEVDIEILESNNKEIIATIKNKSDMSSTISSSLILKEKSFIPFKGNKIQCESDIVHVETNGEVKEVFNCESEIDSTKKYKVNAEIDKF